MNGSIVVHELDSQVLAGNPLGDPTRRELWVYLPPGHDRSRPLPAVLGLTGFTGTGAMLFNRDPLGEDLKRRLDRLIAAGKCPPIMVVAPDCFTRLGGNQYMNSTATGRYEDYLLGEIMPFIEKTYAVSRWGVFGKSSGGFGSMILAMRHPDRFAAVADHSGDANFELCYLGDVPGALDSFRDAGGPTKWLEKFWADDNRHRKKYMRALNILAMAAHYSPNPASPHLGIDFPFDLETGEFRPEVWARWHAWDPVVMAATHAEKMRGLRLIFIDCGSQDEFSLQWGSRALAKRLREHGLTIEHEEFGDGHMQITYRYDVSLPKLARALSE